MHLLDKTIIQEAQAAYKHFAEKADNKDYFDWHVLGAGECESPDTLSSKRFQKNNLIKCRI